MAQLSLGTKEELLLMAHGLVPPRHCLQGTGAASSKVVSPPQGQCVV
jgi:hypothetical protein